MRAFVFTTVAGLLLFALNSATLAEVETFDSQASVTANGWVEFGSREGEFDYGFSTTNNAEGASGGEGGGQIARFQPFSYFADVSAITRDLSLDLNASGRIKLQEVSFNGEAYFGWFNTTLAEESIDPPDTAYLGFQVLEGFRLAAQINRNNTPPAEAIVNPDNDTAYDFRIAWDADGGDADGDGKLTVTLTSLDGSQTLESSTQGHDEFFRVDTVTGYNAFGLLGNSQTGSDQLANFWFDDLEYTLDERKPPGDFNEDGTIDMADFLILANNFDTGRTFAEGDNNFDGRVDLHDFVQFRVLFQAANTQGAAAAVPEPNSLALLSVCAGGLLLATRRRKLRGCLNRHD